MIQFTSTILKFKEQGEKTGWTYIKIAAEIAEKLKPDNKKSFRVKGALDDFSFEGIALLPMGGGDFIMALNAAIRKKIKKRKGDKVMVKLAADEKGYQINQDFIECLKDEPKSLEQFNKLPGSHKNYFSKWIESAKTEPTKAKRIAQAVKALSHGQHYGEMLRELKKEKDIFNMQ